MKRKYPKSSRQCIEPKPSKNRRGGVSEVNMGGRAEVKFGSKMTQNGLSQEERERLKKAHTERLAKMNQSKNPSQPTDTDSKKPQPSESESNSDSILKTEEIEEPEIPDSEDNPEVTSEKASENNGEIDAAIEDKKEIGDEPS